jgi:hypothetical protein
MFWLLATLEAERRGAGDQKQQIKSPHASTDPDEVWVWKKVACAFALLMGSGRPPQALGQKSGYAARRLRQGEAYAFMEALLARWRNYADTPSAGLGSALWRTVVEKLDWLETEAGLEFVKEVCGDMKCGIEKVMGYSGAEPAIGHTCPMGATVCLHCPVVGLTPVPVS